AGPTPRESEGEVAGVEPSYTHQVSGQPSPPSPALFKSETPYGQRAHGYWQ
uniref:Uncharacterized protein n=1 Tax=Aegilops tauschii subsp. strangulata TaxID=200361 RepID=A0A453A6S4_AEGTS